MRRVVLAQPQGSRQQAAGQLSGAAPAYALPVTIFPPGPTWPVSAGALLLGFAVADLTGVRAIGGVVLFLGALWCGLQWRASRGLPLAIALIVLFLALFALSHALGDQIGAWPSVLVVSAVMGAVAWAVADRPAPPHVNDIV